MLFLDQPAGALDATKILRRIKVSDYSVLEILFSKIERERLRRKQQLNTQHEFSKLFEVFGAWP
jgi:hypothetical protein